MIVKYGAGKSRYGPGVSIDLNGEEVATAIGAYLVAHDVHIRGARTIKVNSKLCDNGHIYVDPSGFVVARGIEYSGRGKEPTNECD